VLAQDGFEVVPKLLSEARVAALLEAVGRVRPDESVRRRGGIYAIRNLFQLMPEMAALVQAPPVASLMQDRLRPDAQAVRAIYFDKPEHANWSVPWHQDLSIALREPAELPGYGPHTVKAGVPHTQPPEGLLARMLTLRIHLDPCDARNGALRVLPGSHAAGRLSGAETRAWLAGTPEAVCEVPRGGALLMRPLLLHASSAGTGNAPHRRVLHIEFSPDRLPPPLQWHTALPLRAT